MPNIEVLKQFVAKSPNDPFPRYGLGMELVKLGELEEARAAFAELEEKFPEYIAQYLMHANLLVKMQRSEDARRVLTDGIAVAKKVGNGHALSELQGVLDSL